MSLLLYAIAESDCAPVTGEGLEGRALRAVGDDVLVAVLSDHEGSPAPTEHALWSYEHVVEQLASERSVAPARFGSTFETESTVRDMLRDRRKELTATLDRVRGAVELGVRASLPAVQPDSATPGPNAGTAYMLGRLARERSTRHIAGRVNEALNGLAREYRIQSRPTSPVAASYLVDYDRLNEFVTTVQGLDEMIEEADLVCTGPWPPYSFVEAGRS